MVDNSLIVDAHTHIFPPEICREPARFFERDAYFAELYGHPKAKLATAEQLIASLDANGITAAVALNFGWRDPGLCAETNDYLIDAVRRYPGRIIGGAAVQPSQPRRAAAEIARVRAAGLGGVGELMPDGQGFDPADRPTIEPLAEALDATGGFLLLHASEPVGRRYPGKGTVTPAVIERFLEIVTADKRDRTFRYPCVQIILAHWGGGLPFYALMPEVRARLDRVAFDSAASPFLYRDEIFLAAVGLVGAERILFGTDFPLIGQRRFRERVAALPLPDVERVAILGGNAGRIFGLAEPPAATARSDGC